MKNLNEKAIETSPVNSQTTPGRKISSIFKPKSKQDDDDDNENLGSNLSFSKNYNNFLYFPFVKYLYQFIF